MRKVLILLLFILTFSLQAVSQERYRINKENSSLTIHGTSSLHDWQMDVTDMDCHTSLTKEGNNLTGIENTWFSCRSSSIISDYKLMDKKTHSALKADEFTNITFKVTTVKKLSHASHEFNGAIAGNLFIAGKLKEVTVPFYGKFLENDRVYLEGSVPLKMSEFEIDPPTFLMGTFKTGDQILISYSLNLTKDSSH